MYNLITGPRGWTQTFSKEIIDTLYQMGIIIQDGDPVHLVVDGEGKGVGKPTQFWKVAKQ